MLTTIKMSGVASYTEEATLDTNSPLNLIYGLNGVGKTTISNYLANLNDYAYDKCYINHYDGKILVFNKNFIQKNFYIDDKFPSIFSLAEENINVQMIIDDELKKIELNNENILKLQEQQEKNNNEENKVNIDFQKNLWKQIKIQYENQQNLFDICFTGFKNDKKKMIEHLLSVEKKEQIFDIEKLINEADIINNHNNSAIAPLNVNIDQIVLTSIEDEQILQEIIVGNNNSTIADLIKRLSNSDWVKHGLIYINDKQSSCPFCQQTLSLNLIKEITNYFDDNYEKKMTRLTDLFNKYQSIFDNIKKNQQTYLDNKFIQDNIDNFKILCLTMNNVLDKNLKKIHQKIKSPNNVVTLLKSTNVILDFINYLHYINENINTYNDSINNKQKLKNAIKESFWKAMRFKYDNYISQYKELLSNVIDKKNNCQKLLDEYKLNNEESNKKIKANISKTINTTEAINSMNYNLKWFGLSEFTIIPSSENNKYKLSRNGSSTEFITLSEGEKTIISFLYYIELCKGKSSVKESNIDKVIVIDDPISSLSHNFIFHIADLINQKIFTPLKEKKFSQVFILTHNLYFLNELNSIRKSKKSPAKNLSTKFFRVIKNNISSKIIDMEEEDMCNDYQAYWQIIKDTKNNKISNRALLANSMRNILEHFFGFIQKDNIEYLDELGENFNPFRYYMNKKSHSKKIDTGNIPSDIDVSLFMTAFELVFEKAGYTNHYTLMIGN